MQAGLPVQELAELIQKGNSLEDVEGNHAQVIGEACEHKRLPPTAPPSDVHRKPQNA